MARESVWTTTKRAFIAFGGIIVIMVLAKEIIDNIDDYHDQKCQKLAMTYAKTAKEMDDTMQDYAWRYNELVRRHNAPGVRWLRRRYYHRMDSLNNEIGNVLKRVDELANELNMTRGEILRKSRDRSQRKY